MAKTLSHLQTSWAPTELSIISMSFSSLTQVPSQVVIFILIFSVLCNINILLCIIVKTLKELAESVPQVSTATKLFTDAGLNPQLSGSEAFTLMAPQNDAFKGGVTGISFNNYINKSFFRLTKFTFIILVNRYFFNDT